jgi:ribonuclease BN (tRNA processing enzyme)
LNITGVETCFVQHCFHSFGVKFTVKTELGNDFTLVYSGDCRPSESLVQLGLGEDDAGCDLLVHEATVEDDLEEDAVMKRHCTASEALDVARKMKARRILFTHFSQRYKIPVLSDEVSSSVGIAFDNMQVGGLDVNGRDGHLFLRMISNHHGQRIMDTKLKIFFCEFGRDKSRFPLLESIGPIEVKVGYYLIQEITLKLQSEGTTVSATA